MQIYQAPNSGLVKAWVDGVPIESAAIDQLRNTASLPFIFKWVAAMPDVHLGMGATVGSVVPTKQAIIPAAVGVDIGCGMIAVQTNLVANDLPDSLSGVRDAIESAVPVGQPGKGNASGGLWRDGPPLSVRRRWFGMPEHGETVYPLSMAFDLVRQSTRGLDHWNQGNKAIKQLGTLGGGNHFIEVCLDENDNVWVMLHSGSRGVGNYIGTYFTELARKDMKKWMINLPDKDLAYFPVGTEHFDAYWEALNWAQEYARINREAMLESTFEALSFALGRSVFYVKGQVVACHHNYVAQENHFGENVYVTRKGAVRARTGDLGIIPGSMGTRSYIVAGLGNADSFNSCSHGAGRAMSRSAARKRFTIEDHVLATDGIECRKDIGVLDETPGAYKAIEDVMAAQTDLVETLHELRQVVCVKG